MSARLSERLRQVFKALKKELERNASTLLELLNEDPVRDAITDLFDGKVGETFSDGEMDKLRAEAEDRFKKGLPPGHRDKNKKEEEGASPDGKYGDVIIWKQMVLEAKAQGKGVLFTTDDAKDDWWFRPRGKATPQPFLRKEFFESVGKPLHMYSTARFMERAGTYSKREVDQEAIKEVKETLADLKAAVLFPASLSELGGLGTTSSRLLTESVVFPSLANEGIAKALESVRAMESIDRAAILRDFALTSDTGIAKALEELKLSALGRSNLSDIAKMAEMVDRTALRDLNLATEARMGKWLEVFNQNFAGRGLGGIAKAMEEQANLTALRNANLLNEIGMRAMESDYTISANGMSMACNGSSE